MSFYLRPLSATTSLSMFDQEVLLFQLLKDTMVYRLKMHDRSKLDDKQEKGPKLMVPLN